MLAGLAFIASRWPVLGRGWRVALITGVLFDFYFGIALHFGVQSYALDRWLTPGRPMADTVNSYSHFAVMNLLCKEYGKVEFLGDALTVPAALVIALLAAILTLAIARAVQRPD